MSIPPIELIHFARKHNISKGVVQYLSTTFPDAEIFKKVLESMVVAPNQYYLRLNLTKTTPANFIKQWKKIFPTWPMKITPLPNSIQIPIQGPFNFSKLPHEVYCDKYAAEAVQIGADLFMPGVTGMNGKLPVDTPVSIVLAHDHRPESFPHEQAVYHVANGITRLNSKDYVHQRHGVFVHTTQSRYKVAPYRSSLFYQQGLLSEHTLPPNFAVYNFMQLVWNHHHGFPENITILDTCSAPGHKTTGMAEWGYFLAKTEEKQKETLETPETPEFPAVISIDRSSNRLKHLAHDKKRLGLQGIRIIPEKLERILTHHPELEEQADYLFFDPPCSALGTRPKLFIDKNLKRLQDFSSNQARLFDYVNHLVKPGGYLMYNTCTLAFEENEDMIANILSHYDYQVCALPHGNLELGQQGLPHPKLSTSESLKLRRFIPGQHGAEMGYFIALLQKKSA